MAGRAPEDQNVTSLLCALSFATSLALGDRTEHGLRTAWIGVRLAEALGLSDSELQAVLYGALLKDIGCTACGPMVSAFFPDQSLPNLDLMLTDRTQLQRLVVLLTRYVPLDAALPGRLARFLSFVSQCRPILRESLAGHCEVAEMFASELGLGENVQKAVRFQWEHWDGKGVVYGLRGVEAPAAARVLHLAQMVEFAHDLGGTSAAEGLAKERSGTRFDPEIVGAFLALSARGELWRDLDKEDLDEVILTWMPGDQPKLTGDRTDAVCAALASLADSKVSLMNEHSFLVAAAAEKVGRSLGLGAAEESRLRRIGLVHDLGTVTLPTTTLEKGNRLSAAERERFRFHPYHTGRVLDRAAPLKELAAEASAHHEQLDGKGYYRGLSGTQIPLGARILAIADRFVEQQEAGKDTQHALDELEVTVGSELDGDCYRALRASLSGGGNLTAGFRRRSKPGVELTDRETEVLRLLTRGWSNPAIARDLVISTKTVEHHVEHIFVKLNITSRTSAAVYAVQHGLT